MGFASVVLISCGLRIFRRKILASSKLQNLNLLCAEHYTEPTRIEWCVGIPCCSLYANMMSLCIRDLSMYRFWWGVLELVPLRIQRDDCISFLIVESGRAPGTIWVTEMIIWVPGCQICFFVNKFDSEENTNRVCLWDSHVHALLSQTLFYIWLPFGKQLMN